MPTSLHIPSSLLAAVDRRAKALQMSRNRFILSALERELSNQSGWSAGFFDRLKECDEGINDDVDDMMKHVRAARTSKKAHKL
jgi:predicted transcriptional regulator